MAPRGYADAPSDALRIIAVGFDGSAESHAAVEHAVRLAEAARAGLKIITVAPTAPPFGWGAVAYSYDELRLADREDRRQKLADLAASLPSSLRPAERLRDGDPATEIVAECETAVDLLVLGSRGYGAFRRAMLGSVSTRVVREVSCPVMVVPQSSSKPAGPERRESRAVEA